MQGYKFYVPASISLIKHNASPFISLDGTGFFAIARFSDEESDTIELNGNLGTDYQELIKYIISYVQSENEIKAFLRRIEFDSPTLLCSDNISSLVTALMFQIMHAWTYKSNDYDYWLKLCGILNEKFDINPSSVWASFKGGIQSVNTLTPLIANRWSFPSDWRYILIKDKKEKPRTNSNNGDILPSLALNVSTMRQKNIGLLLNVLSTDAHPLTDIQEDDKYLAIHLYGGIYKSNIDKYLYISSNSSASKRLVERIKDSQIEIDVYTLSRGTRRL